MDFMSLCVASIAKKERHLSCAG